MKLFKSITVKLYVLLSIFLISFICLIIYVQICVLGRSYMITEHSEQREIELIKDMNEDFYGNYVDYSLGKSDLPNYNNIILEEEEIFEGKNNANIFILDNNYNVKIITKFGKNNLNKSLLNNISNTLKNNTTAKKSQISFRVYNSLHIPSKYIAISTPAGNNLGYVVIAFKDVFTNKNSGMIESYIIYVLIALIVLILVITGIMSYIITRPVIKINNAAAKMIEMDFSVKCDVKSSDEIGRLAGSLNFLSDKLSCTINELQAANGELKKDLNNQRELDLLRKDFLAGVSHEFKTPITIIKGYIEGIKDDVMNSSEKEDAYDIITAEASKMDKLVQGLLDISTMESEHYSLNLSDVLVEELLNDISKKYVYIMQERKIEFQTVFSCYGCMVNVDCFRIEQVITNFINNAIANTESGKKIILSAEKNEYNVFISVENEGHLINEEDLKRIWEKFYRVDKSRSKKYGGTGLGLAISKTILELHGSEFGVKNTKKGVKFYFMLKIV